MIEAEEVVSEARDSWHMLCSSEKTMHLIQVIEHPDRIE
jgi:hypothetical protein